MRKKKFNKHILFPLIVAVPLLCVSIISIAQADWISTVQHKSWEPGIQTLYNVVFDYNSGDDQTIYGLERSSKLDLPTFNDDRYESVWKIGSHEYSGVVSIDTLFNDSSSKPYTTVGKTKTYTLTLEEYNKGLNDGYFEIYIHDCVDITNSNSPQSFTLTSDYSLITQISTRFLVFNINPIVDGKYLDHFVYNDGVNTPTTYGLNDSLYVDTGGADASKLDSNKRLTLIAYFKTTSNN